MLIVTIECWPPKELYFSVKDLPSNAVPSSVSEQMKYSVLLMIPRPPSFTRDLPSVTKTITSLDPSY